MSATTTRIRLILPIIVFRFRRERADESSSGTSDEDESEDDQEAVRKAQKQEPPPIQQALNCPSNPSSSVQQCDRTLEKHGQANNQVMENDLSGDSDVTSQPVRVEYPDLSKEDSSFSSDSEDESDYLTPSSDSTESLSQNSDRDLQCSASAVNDDNEATQELPENTNGDEEDDCLVLSAGEEDYVIVADESLLKEARVNTAPRKVPVSCQPGDTPQLAVSSVTSTSLTMSASASTVRAGPAPTRPALACLAPNLPASTLTGPSRAVGGVALPKERRSPHSNSEGTRASLFITFMILLRVNDFLIFLL